MSLVSRRLGLAELSEIVPGGQLPLSVSRVTIVSVIGAVFPLMVCFTSTHCSLIVSVDVEGRKYSSNLHLRQSTVLTPWLLSD